MKTQDTMTGEDFAALWKVEDVMRYLGVSKAWVYKRAAAGKLPRLNVGGLVRFDPEDVKKYARGELTSGQVVALSDRQRPVR